MARQGAERGDVFCARVGDRTQPQFRYVAYPADGKPVVLRETLVCLTHATPDQGLDTERVLRTLKPSRSMLGRARKPTSLSAGAKQWTLAISPL